ncbi:MAG: TonB-dependent receptor plug domain-containing protein, partial [Allosphingosinicella sp.]
AAEFDEEDGEEIVVTGARERGAVVGDIDPELQLDRRDIRALGAGSISELLDAIAPQTRSGRGRDGGRPVTLLNGRRISGFSEIRDIPPEAIERVDILPEEVALKYGYRADQRVVNIVLRRRFRAVTAEANGGLATAGGRATYGFDVNMLRIDRAGRISLDAEYQHADPLFESERDIIQATPVVVDLGDFRTLLSATDQVTLGGTVNRTVLGDVSATLNGRFDANESLSLLGRRDLGGDALTRESQTLAGHIGLALNGQISPKWRWSGIANYDRSSTDTSTETQIGRDRSESLSQVGSADLTASGPVFKLPAGDVNASLRAGADARSLESETRRGGIAQARDLSRQRAAFQANLDVPIASRRREILQPLGDLSVNFNAELEHFSDFGTLRTLGAGLNWSPIRQLDIIASVTDEDGAPSMQQLGDPAQVTPNVRVFDFIRSETVDINRIEGGNPDLAADNRRVFKLGLNLKPFADKDLTFNANYTKSRILNPIASFPTATAEIEAAFPDRFQRDANGRLIRIDSRPVNFARSDRQELRWGINFSRPIGPQPPPGGFRGRRGAGAADGAAPQGGGQAAPGGAPPSNPGQGAREGGRRWQGGGGGGGGFRGGRGRGFGGGRGGRIQLALYHNWRLEDRILIREGLPELDLLSGSAVGSRGGQPRHELEFQAGIFKNGMGARLTANWQNGTTVNGRPDGLGGTTGDLHFSDFATFNLRLFADLGQQRDLARKHPWLRGTRVTLSVNNLLDSRLQVRDEAGQTPLSYQPGFIDPLGRSVRLSVRKLFF